MVVLSACETGLGKVEFGEGVRSLGKSFLEAGASSIVYSLWTVNDLSTAKIMSAFYSYLKKGKTKDVAMQQARLDYLRQADSLHRNPYFWAGFVLHGEWK